MPILRIYTIRYRGFLSPGYLKLIFVPINVQVGNKKAEFGSIEILHIIFWDGNSIVVSI